MSIATGGYYIPHAAKWPIVGSISLFTLFLGLASWLNGSDTGKMMFFAGCIALIIMMFGWFGTVIRESESGTYNPQVDNHSA